MELSVYLNDFNPKTWYELRNRFPRDLAEAQKTTLTIENNRRVVGIIDKRENHRVPQQTNNYQYK